MHRVKTILEIQQDDVVFSAAKPGIWMTCAAASALIATWLLFRPSVVTARARAGLA